MFVARRADGCADTQYSLLPDDSCKNFFLLGFPPLLPAVDAAATSRGATRLRFAPLHYFLLLCRACEHEGQSQKQQPPAIVPDVPSWMNGTSPWTPPSAS